MELILARLEKGTLVEVAVLDEFISYNNVLSLKPTMDANDWELQITYDVFQDLDIKLDDWVYIAESEFGGIVKNIENKNDIIYLSGPNFRGYLTKHIIVPPYLIEGIGTFTDYIRWSGDANELVWNYFQRDDSQISDENLRSDPYVVGTLDTIGVNLNTKFRFVQYLQAMSNLLKDNNLRLEAKHVYIDYENDEDIAYPDHHGLDKSFVFKIEAKQINDYSEDETFSNDFNIKINSGVRTDNERRFVFALGSGELQDRTVVVLKDGVEIPYGYYDSQGALWDADIFDYPNAESREELIENAQKFYLENLLKNEYVELDLEDVEIEFFLGDKVSAYDEITEIHTVAEITEKELTITQNGIEKLYKVGGNI